MASPDYFNLSNMQHDQSQQAAPNIPSMGFEAATAALDTNELLHLIIAKVPRQYRTKLRSVSRNWKAAVEKLGHAFGLPRPIGNSGPTCMLPMYGINEFGKRLVCNKTNPAIACYTEEDHFDCPGCVMVKTGVTLVIILLRAFTLGFVSIQTRSARNRERSESSSSSRTRPSR
jgi:hypothetical protein